MSTTKNRRQQQKKTDAHTRKKTYHRPALAFYGKVAEITTSGSSGVPEFGSPFDPFLRA